VPGWLQSDPNDFKITVLDKPMRSQIDAPVQEQMIVELYSK
jgi:small subunit ribosomal protein S4